VKDGWLKQNIRGGLLLHVRVQGHWVDCGEEEDGG
jgi:hypothetical protein